jgi:hypothetical protein
MKRGAGITKRPYEDEYADLSDFTQNQHGHVATKKRKRATKRLKRLRKNSCAF